MTKKVNSSCTLYTYNCNGKTYPIFEGKNGVTKEIILLLKEMDHQEELQVRYLKENTDYKSEFLKGIKAIDDRISDPVENLSDSTYSPESILFSEEKRKTRKDILDELVLLLTQNQQSLYRYLMMGLKVKEIAAIFRTSEDAIKKRKRKLIAHLQKLFYEKYPEGLPKSGNRQEPKETTADVSKLPDDESVTIGGN